jgi:hypothetical protein
MGPAVGNNYTAGFFEIFYLVFHGFATLIVSMDQQQWLALTMFLIVHLETIDHEKLPIGLYSRSLPKYIEK